MCLCGPCGVAKILGVLEMGVNRNTIYGMRDDVEFGRIKNKKSHAYLFEKPSKKSDIEDNREVHFKVPTPR